MTRITVPGFLFAGVAAGIKKRAGALDVALAVATPPDPRLCAMAGVFTRNRLAAAPVQVSRARLARRGARAVVVNSGNANAATGAAGLRDAEEMTARAAAACGLRPAEVAVASTGVIGMPLPMARVRAGIDRAAAALAPGADGFAGFARAILTTDKGPKVHAAGARVGGTRITVAGCAKGAGMIAPNLATTLAFVFTDAVVDGPWLRRLLVAEADLTFNRISVDGDTSTNDSLFALASGAAKTDALAHDRGPGGQAFVAALHEVLLALATQIVRDGEGATKVVTIHVTGARSARDARAVARRIAGSPLVKTALHGADPNWGRILAAVGNAGVPVDPARLEVDLGRVPVVRGGVGVHAPDTERRSHEVMRRPEYAIRVGLGAGAAEASVTTCDLSPEYVTINADYRS